MTCLLEPESCHQLHELIDFRRVDQKRFVKFAQFVVEVLAYGLRMRL